MDDRWEDVIHVAVQSHLEHLTYEFDMHTLETLILEQLWK